ncbi:hypothetical protein [Streptomyces adustus]
METRFHERLIIGLVIALALTIGGEETTSALAAGGTSLAFTFGAGMAALSYIKRQDS